MADSSDAELSLKVPGFEFSLRGRAYEDLRPVVNTGTATVTNVLEVLENAVGVSCDFANHHLKRFGTRYQKGVYRIPENFRELPPFRLGCTVIREVVFAAEEPELQEVFAQLLITGSDNRTQQNAFPGFATTIGQLTRFDTQLLNQLTANDWRLAMSQLTRVKDGDDDVTEIAFYNLRRLGLVDWWHIEPNPFYPETAASDFARLVDADTTRKKSGMHALIEFDISKGLEGATRNFGMQIVELLKQTQNPLGIKTTTYGQLFVSACFGEVQNSANAAPVQHGTRDPLEL